MNKKIFYEEEKQYSYSPNITFDNSLKKGDTIVFEALTKGSFYQQWYKDSKPIIGETKNKLVLSITSKKKAGNYWLQVDGKRIEPTKTIKVNVKGNKSSLIWILATIGVLLLFLSFLSGNLHKPTRILTGDYPNVTSAKKMTEDQLNKYAQKKVDESAVTINVYPKIKINQDGKTGSIWIQNIPTNGTGQEAILLNQKGEVLFRSGLIKPGNEVKSLTLEKKIKSGEYKGSIVIHFYDLKEKKELGQTSVEVSLDVA